MWHTPCRDPFNRMKLDRMIKKTVEIHSRKRYVSVRTEKRRLLLCSRSVFPTIVEPRTGLFRLEGMLGVLWDRKKPTSYPHSLQRSLVRGTLGTTQYRNTDTAFMIGHAYLKLYPFRLFACLFISILVLRATRLTL